MAEKKIHGKTYKVEPMLAMDAIRLKAKLLGVIGAAAERLPTVLAGAGDKATKAEKEASNAAAVAAFTDLFVNGDPEQMTCLIKEVVEIAQVAGESGQYYQADVDRFTSDDLSELFEVAVFVLRETFGAFFSGLLKNGKIKKAMKA